MSMITFDFNINVLIFVVQVHATPTISLYLLLKKCWCNPKLNLSGSLLITCFLGNASGRFCGLEVLCPSTGFYVYNFMS